MYALWFLINDLVCTYPVTSPTIATVEYCATCRESNYIKYIVVITLPNIISIKNETNSFARLNSRHLCQKKKTCWYTTQWIALNDTGGAVSRPAVSALRLTRCTGMMTASPPLSYPAPQRQPCDKLKLSFCLPSDVNKHAYSHMINRVWLVNVAKVINRANINWTQICVFTTRWPEKFPTKAGVYVLLIFCCQVDGVSNPAYKDISNCS